MMREFLALLPAADLPREETPLMHAGFLPLIPTADLLREENR